MIIENVNVSQIRGKTRLTADIIFRGRQRESLYYEVESRYRNFVTQDATPFLITLLIPCMKLGENIVVRGTVSHKLLHAIEKIMHLLISWNLGLKKVMIEVSKTRKGTLSTKNIGIFFSGGVDSYSTYLKQKRSSGGKITHLIFIRGFDIRLDDKAMYTNVLSQIEKVTRMEGVCLITVRTNARMITDNYVEWDYAHGAVLAGIAAALRGGFVKVFISGGMEYAALRPYGSHPDLDPLWSTEHTSIIHDGCGDTRFEKIAKYISKSGTALQTLRVCWRNKKGQYNCCECEKCLRTMLSLLNVGVLRKSRTFPKPINIRKLSRLFLRSNEVRYFQENLDILEQNKKHPEVAQAIARCIARYHAWQEHRSFFRRARERFALLDRRYLNGQIFFVLSRKGFI